MAQPFYDPTKTYDENYADGPYGDFANPTSVAEKGEPTHDFLGVKVYEPFGIPAGPLLNSKFVDAAFKMGYDICVYKTVRANPYPCHPFPNVLAVHPDGDLTMEKAQDPLVADTNYTEPIAITNSFGVPSKAADVWTEDAKKAVAAAGKGQVMVMSFMGTVKEGQTEEEFIEDHRQGAKSALETGAPILEVNLSCPNIGNEGLICYNLDMTRKVTAAIREVIGKTPLILKVGYYADDAPLKQLAEIANEYADAISAINTIQATIIDEKGEQALPGGPTRARSGVCGAPIKWAGLEMTKRLSAIRKDGGYKFAIVGVGGVTTPEDYQEYRAAGADAVMSATGAMWNPKLAQQIKSIK
jgi:dihydroorotate dehydrogenase